MQWGRWFCRFQGKTHFCGKLFLLRSSPTLMQALQYWLFFIRKKQQDNRYTSSL